VSLFFLPYSVSGDPVTGARPVFVTRGQFARDLAALGIEPGDMVMVHSSMRGVGPVPGGPDVVIRALLDAVGQAGTVMAYRGTGSTACST
jgi:hypothetical protein